MGVVSDWSSMPQHPSFRSGPFVGLGRVDVALGVSWFAILFVIDAVTLSIGRHSSNVNLFWSWAAFQAAVCLVGGFVQAFRRRHLLEVLAVGVIAAAVLVLAIMFTVNPDAGSSDCPGQGPCDTSFGLGYIVIGVLVTPIFGGISALGSLAARASLRLGDRSQPVPF